MVPNQKIVPFLWFDDNSDRVAEFYVSLFEGGRILETTRYGAAAAEASGMPEGAVMMVTFQLGDVTFGALNGRREFAFTPAASFFVTCTSEPELDRLFRELSAGGDVLLGLDTYPFSRKYAWVEDRFGVSWQLSLGMEDATQQRVSPALLFVGSQRGRAEEAMHLYLSLFHGSEVRHVDRYGAGDRDPDGTIRHAEFDLAGQTFIVMDSAREHDFTFTPAVSFLINCDTQDEVDALWGRLTDGGTVMACGWLRDRYGVTWQVVPAALHALIRDPERGERVMRAMVRMEKLDLPTLERA